MDPHLVPGIPCRLNDQVMRIVAPNGGPMTGAGTNTYLVGTDELVVIDPGPDIESHVMAILAAAQCEARNGASPVARTRPVAGACPIKWILCTHTHEDHSPAAGRLQDLTGASIAGMRAPVTDHDSELHLDRELADGDVVACGGAVLQAVHTPGHASNHLCFLLRSSEGSSGEGSRASGMLFTGDHIMQGSTVVIWPPDGNMRAYMQSLRSLLDLPLRTLAPGHGHLIDDPRAEVERLIQHRLRREEKVRKAILRARGPVTIQMLLPSAYEDVPHTLHRMAALSLQAHLEKLVEEGELSRSGAEYRIN